MILDLFIVLVAISFGCLFLGHFTADKVYALVGLALLFLLGIVLITQSLQVQTGVVIAQNGTSLSVVNQYAFFADTNAHWFGWLMSSLSMGGFIIIMFGAYGNFNTGKDR